MNNEMQSNIHTLDKIDKFHKIIKMYPIAITVFKKTNYIYP